MATRSDRSKERAEYIAKRAKIRSTLLRKRRYVPAKDAISSFNVHEHSSVEVRNWVNAHHTSTTLQLMMQSEVVSVMTPMLDRTNPINRSFIEKLVRLVRVQRLFGFLTSAKHRSCFMRATARQQYAGLKLMCTPGRPITADALAYAVENGLVEVAKILRAKMLSAEKTQEAQEADHKIEYEALVSQAPKALRDEIEAVVARHS